MNKVLIILFLLFNFVVVSAQNFPTKSDFPKLRKEARRCENFVPKSWKIMSKALGDLNKDKSPDCVLVIKGSNAKFFNEREGFKDVVYDTNPRMLVILFKNAEKNHFELAKQSNTFILIPESPNMSEPFQNVSIKNNVLRLDFEQWYSAGSWAASQMSYKFRFQKGEFVLIGADKTKSIRNSGETETRSYNFMTGKVKIETGNYTSDEKGKIEWKTLKLEKLRTIDTFKEPFSWEIEYGYYI